MVKVKLMGELGEKFGTDWVSADNNMRDILKLIEAQCDGFAEYIADLVQKDNVGLEIVHGDSLLIETEDDIADMFLPVIKDTVYITPVPAGAGFGDVFKIIIGVALMIFAPQIATFLANATQIGVVTVTGVAGSYGVAAAWLTYAVAAMGGLLALKGLTDYLTPQTPGNSPESYLFGNSQENVKMGSPVPLLYGELIVPGVTINYALKDVKVGRVGGYSYGGTSGGGATGGGGGGGGGCFVADTQITMKDGTFKPIQDVKVGDIISSMKNDGSIAPGEVLEITTPVVDTIAVYKIGNIVLECTPDHPIYIDNKGWCSLDPYATKQNHNLDVSVITVNDCVVLEDIDTSTNIIQHIEIKQQETQTYNLSSVKDYHTYFANGVLVHNKGGGGGSSRHVVQR